MSYIVSVFFDCDVKVADGIATYDYSEINYTGSDLATIVRDAQADAQLAGNYLTFDHYASDGLPVYMIRNIDKYIIGRLVIAAA